MANPKNVTITSMLTGRVLFEKEFLTHNAAKCYFMEWCGEKEYSYDYSESGEMVAGGISHDYRIELHENDED